VKKTKRNYGVRPKVVKPTKGTWIASARRGERTNRGGAKRRLVEKKGRKVGENEETGRTDSTYRTKRGRTKRKKGKKEN